MLLHSSLSSPDAFSFRNSRICRLGCRRKAERASEERTDIPAHVPLCLGDPTARIRAGAPFRAGYWARRRAQTKS